LPEDSILSDAFIRELMNVGEVDIVVGVPTFNDAQTIGQVIQSIREGLLAHFPRQRAVIINADGGSRDGTQDLVRAAAISDQSLGANLKALRTLHSISTQYDGGPANGIALHTILAASDLLQAKLCAVLSPEATTLTPEWVDRLLKPVLNQSADLVLPVYRRHKFDGLLIRNLLYPMTRAVYGCAVREPYPSDFGFSGRLGSHLLAQDIWGQEQGRRGTELWMTLSAIVGGMKIFQAFLGDKSRSEHAPTDLVAAMRESAGVLFSSLDSFAHAWTAPLEPHSAPCLNCEPAVSLDPLRLNRKRLHQMFVFGVSELEPVFLSILSAGTHEELRRLARLPEESFEYPPDLWAHTVYEFAAAYHKAVIGRDHIVQALVPLFRGRAYTFLTQNRESSAEEVERSIEEICASFEKQKPFLIETWNGRK
jgi:hypothetical protein